MENKNGIFEKIRHFANEFSTLITWSLESSMETSMSMESRGYGLKGRTSFNRFRFTLKDTFTIIIMLVCFVMAVIPIAGKKLCSILSTCNILYEIRCRRSAGSYSICNTDSNSIDNRDNRRCAV